MSQQQTIDPATAATIDVIDRFNDVFNRHDVPAIMALMTDNVVFENTSLVTAAQRYEGQAAVRGFWEQFFTSSPHAHFATEEQFACGDRCVVRWLYTWVDKEGTRGQVRGVDLFRVRDGKVAEKLSYVKG